MTAAPEGMSGEFIPPGSVTDDFKPLGNNMADIARAVDTIAVEYVGDGAFIPATRPPTHDEPEAAPVSDNVRRIRALARKPDPRRPQPAAPVAPTRSADPRDLIRERIAEVDMDLAELRVAIARVKGLEIEKRQLKRALEAFDNE